MLVVGLFLPIFGTTAKRGIQTMSLSNAKQLATGCRLYADDHGGRLPIHLSELAPDYLTKDALENLRYIASGTDEKSRILMDWLYFGAGFDETNAPPILIASPQATVPDGKKQSRIVVGPDTFGAVVREPDYQQKLAETIKQMRSMDDRRSKAPPTATPAPAEK